LNNFVAQPNQVIRFILLLSFQIILHGFILAQNNDTSSGKGDSLYQLKKNPSPDNSLNTTRSDTSADSMPGTRANFVRKDSVLEKFLIDTGWMAVSAKYSGKNFIRQGFEQNRFFGFSSSSIAVTSNKKVFKGKELLFYVIIAILLFFAFIRFSFPKYILDLFRVAFRTTIKQRQIGEQLLQTPLPSLLLNFFFLISTSLYIGFLLKHYSLTDGYNFWLLFFYCFIGLAVIYVVKFLSLKFSGWLFNISSTTDGYIFIVFLINKIIGIYLLPFLVLLAFADNGIYQAALTLSYIGVFFLIAYRFILSYGLAQNQIRLNPFQFFLYLCAFEIIPLLLIYKALLLWF
jgi:hypothetical protein